MKEIRTTITGNATGDVATTRHPDGNITARLRIAVNSRYFDAERNAFVDRKPEFINVYARKALARGVLNSVRKGQPLIVTGRLSSQSWKDEQGTTHHALAIHADAIGHDLTFGSTIFTKAERAAGVPDVDENGEIRTGTTSSVMGEEAGEGIDGGLQDDALNAEDALTGGHREHALVGA